MSVVADSAAAVPAAEDGKMPRVTVKEAKGGSAADVQPVADNAAPGAAGAPAGDAAAAGVGAAAVPPAGVPAGPAEGAAGAGAADAGGLVANGDGGGDQPGDGNANGYYDGYGFDDEEEDEDLDNFMAKAYQLFLEVGGLVGEEQEQREEMRT